MKHGISIQNVSFQYPGNQPLLLNVSLSIQEGSFLGITGRNGSGKTTLIHLLNGLIPHEIQGKFTGKVFIDGNNTRSKSVPFFARKVGMVFQNPDFMLFNITVEDEIAFGLDNFKFKNHKSRITDALAMVGLQGFEKRDPHTLSLGEKQKLTLACVLALDTPYIVLDEPVAMLDYSSAVQLYTTLATINKQTGKTIIVVEHDTDFIFTFAHRTAVLNRGEIALEGETSSVFAQKKLITAFGIKVPHQKP